MIGLCPHGFSLRCPICDGDIAALSARLKEADALLRDLEWADGGMVSGEMLEWCPECGNLRKMGHTADCRMAAYLSRDTFEDEDEQP